MGESVSVCGDETLRASLAIIISCILYASVSVRENKNNWYDFWRKTIFFFFSSPLLRATRASKNFRFCLMDYMSGAVRNPSVAAAPLRFLGLTSVGLWYRERILRCAFDELETTLFHCPHRVLVRYGALV